MKKLFSCIAVAAACTLAGSAQAGTLTIDFNHVPGADGILGTADDTATPAGRTPTWIRDEYAQVGVHFTLGSIARGANFDGNPGNVYLTSTGPEAWFDIPVYGISIDSHSFWNATLTAYDVAGNVLATDRVHSPGGVYDATLSVTSGTAIYRFSVLPDNPDHILNLDNLTLTVSAVPEPAQGVLLGAGLLVLGAIARRRKQ